MKLTLRIEILVLCAVTLAATTAIISRNQTIQAQTSETTVAQRPSSSLSTLDPGVAEFLANPTQFQFACGGLPGRVTSASVDGDTLTIGYTYPAGNEVRTGQLVGSISPDGRFTGTYDTQSRLGQLQGNITFTFATDGTARGRYGNGFGSARIFL